MEAGFLDFNPADGVKRPRQVAKSETLDLTDEEVMRLFEGISEKATPLHRAILMTFFTTGIRKSELIEIKLSDLQEINGEMTMVSLFLRASALSSSLKLVSFNPIKTDILTTPILL